MLLATGWGRIRGDRCSAASRGRRTPHTLEAGMRRAPLFLAIVLVCAAPVAAHHGAGTFDLSQSIAYPEATLTRVDLINPHAWLYFEVTETDGRVSKHRCEMRSAHVLRRSGWSQELFPIGARVAIEASPDRIDPNSCYLQTIRFENGSHMDRYGQYVKAEDGAIREVRGPIAAPDVRSRPLRRPGGEPYIAGDWAPEQRVMADPRGTGGGLVPLGRLAEIDQGQEAAGGGGGGRGGGAGADGPRLYGGTPLTARGEQAAAQFTRDDNPRFRCETTSILFDWTFDGPVNRIIQGTSRIVMRYGQMGLERTIRMDKTEHPADVMPTRAGHSIGRWEGDVLVVETVGFLPGVLNSPVRHSDQLRVVERFSLDPGTMTLRREYEATDPVYLQGTYTGSDVIQAADAPYTDDKCDEQAFIDYSQTQGGG
jgi:hypothetical protein